MQSGPEPVRRAPRPRVRLRRAPARWVAAGIVLTALAIFVVWRWPVRYSTDSLARLVPADVPLFVSARGLSARIDRIVDSHAGRRLAEAPKIGKRIRRRPKWLIDLLGREAAFAVRPAPGGARPDLLLLGWVGHRARHLDPLAHGIQILPDSDYRLEDRPHGRHQVTRIYWEDFPDGSIADYVVIRGVFLFTLSWREGAIEELIDRWDHGAPSLATTPAWRSARAWAARDRHSFGYGFGWDPADPGSIALLYLAERDGGTRIEISVPSRAGAGAPPPPSADDPLFTSLPADSMAVGFAATADLETLASTADRLARRADLPVSFPPPRLRLGDRVIACLPPWAAVSDNIPVLVPQIIVGGDLRSLRNGFNAFRAAVAWAEEATSWDLRVDQCPGLPFPSLCVGTTDRMVRDRLGVRELPAAVFPSGQWRFGTHRSVVVGCARRGEPLAETAAQALAGHDGALWIDIPTLLDNAEGAIGMMGVLRFWLRSMGRDLPFEFSTAEALPCINAARALTDARLTLDRDPARLQARLDLHFHDLAE